MSIKVFVAVPTIGRAAVTRQTIDRLAEQTRAPDGVVVVGVSPADVEGLDDVRVEVQVAFAERGLCKQRNRCLDLIGDRADVVIFFDDDFVASPDYVEQVAALFETRPEVVGATGRIIADGINCQGIEFDEAVQLVNDDVEPEPFETVSMALYGCNMCIRMSAVQGLRFDEALPLYGWQEDIDFTYQIGQRGAMVKNSRISGVHMGNKAARTPGKRLGYSQISNPVYLLRKGSMPRDFALRLMVRNFGANLLRSLNPEPHVDRRGRLTGNLMALMDLVLGKVDPRRILELT